MKILGFSFFLLLVTACDPYRFGFKENPAYVLDTALKAVLNEDHQTFLEVSGKEALCLYGNNKGVQHLKLKQEIDAASVKINPVVLWSKHHKNQEFRGYWVYFGERYLVTIQEKNNEKTILETVVECYYGAEGEKNERFLNLERAAYPKKECKLIKIVPKNFEPLPMSAKCEVMKVELEPLKASVVASN